MVEAGCIDREIFGGPPRSFLIEHGTITTLSDQM
jgi:hypothetical protein